MAVKVQVVTGTQPLFRWHESGGREKLKLPYIVENGEVLNVENGAGRVLALVKCDQDPPQVSCGQTHLTLEKNIRVDYTYLGSSRVVFGFTWLTGVEAN